MAFTLSTIYKAVDQYSPIVRKMEQANSSFAAKQDRAFRQMRSSMANVKNQLIGLAGGVSIASIFYMGSRAVVQFDESLNSLSAITGITGKDFEVFKKEVIDVAARTKKAGYEVAKAFELVGSAQPELLKDAKALAKVSEAAITLSKASRDDLSTSAANVTSVLNQFSLGAEHAERAINVLAAGSVVGAANISEVTEAMKNVGAVASSSNAMVEETVALIEVLGKFQLKGAEAGTKLRGVFIKLQQAGYGYQTGQFKINDALVEAQKKINALRTEKEKDAFITKMFGLENLTAGKILMSNTALFEEYTKGVTGTSWATKQAEINSASFSVKLQELKARFENLIIKGNENSKTLNKLGKIIGFVTEHLDKIITVIGLGVAAWLAYYTIMSAVRIGMIAYNVVMGIFYATQSAVPIALTASAVAMKAYAVGIKIAKVATWLFSAVLWACPITWIVAGIIAIVVAIVLLVKHWDKVKAKMDEWSNSAVFQIISILNPIVKVIELIAFMQDRWQGIKKAFSEGGFLEGIKAIGKAILSFMLKPIEVILGALGKIPGLGFAKKGSEFIAQMRANLDEGLLSPTEEKPVNVQKSSNDVQTERYEEITKQQMSFELYNKTDKGVNIKKNQAEIPGGFNTWAW